MTLGQIDNSLQEILRELKNLRCARKNVLEKKPSPRVYISSDAIDYGNLEELYRVVQGVEKLIPGASITWI